MQRQRLSIAMCTYNGARYLQEQLDSIAAQTRLPDELVICDDRSTDITTEIAEAYLNKVKFPVRVYVNSEKLGSTKNFEKAISLCQGDLIALSDQDDFWQPEKLEHLESVFETCQDVGAVFSNAELVDQNMQPLEYRLWQSVGFGKAVQERFLRGESFNVLLKRNVVTGATMAFRAIFRDLILPIPQDWVHDGWVALLISHVARLAFIPEPLIKYRQHGGSQIGARKRSFAEKLIAAINTERSSYIGDAERFDAVLERLAVERSHNKDIALLHQKIRHLRIRGTLPDRKLWRSAAVLKELITLGYQRYSNGWKSAAVDLLR